jgi:hypothetical protein
VRVGRGPDGSARLLDISAERTVTVDEEKRSPEQEQEWLRQLSLIYSGLILVGVYLVPVEVARVVAQNLAFVGVVAGFWHISWIAGVGMLASGIVGVAIYTAGYTRLERDQEPTPQEGEEPGDTES